MAYKLDGWLGFKVKELTPDEVRARREYLWEHAESDEQGEYWEKSLMYEVLKAIAEGHSMPRSLAYAVIEEAEIHRKEHVT